MRLFKKTAGTVIGNFRNNSKMKRIRLKSIEMAREYSESYDFKDFDLPKEGDRLPKRLKTKNAAGREFLQLINLYSNLIYLLNRHVLYENPGVLVLLTMYMNEEIRRVSMELMIIENGSLKEDNPTIEDIELVFYNQNFLKAFIRLERFIELMNAIERNELYCLKDEKRCINNFMGKYR